MLSRTKYRKMVQNLLWATTYNALVILLSYALDAGLMTI